MVAMMPRFSRRFVLVSFVLAAASLGAWAQPPVPDQSITQALKPFVDRHAIAGAVTLVADKDKVLSVAAVGYADLEAKKPMQPDCLFWIASQSKPITATALMMLVDEGKVNVDDPVEKYLPAFKGQMVAVERDADHVLLKKPQHPILVRNVLSHTSGLPPTSLAEHPSLDLLPLRVGALTYAMMPLDFEPDTKYQYSNAGINTAGRIIEVVSGMPYEEFLQKRLFEPLGMKDTTFWPNAEQLKRLATSYKPNASKDGLEAMTITQLKYPLDDHTRQPMPAGGLFSTASDLARFCQMILNDGTFEGKRLLSEAAVKQMTTKQTADSIVTPYGFGWAVGGDVVGHGGAYATNMGIHRKNGLITIWMVQESGGFPRDGKEAQNAFNKAAMEQFGKK